jgi:hypothetical protein
VSEAEEIIATFFPGLDERSQPIVRCLIDLVLDVVPEAQHERKWGQLCFTRDGDWHHWICAIASTNKAVKLVIHKGALLADPRGVLQGDGQYLRAISFRPPEEVDARIVAPILREAVARQTEM